MFELFSTGRFAFIAQVQQAGDIVKDTPITQQSWFIFLLLVAAVVLGWFLSRTITNRLRLSEYSGRMATVLIAVLIAALMIWSKWPPSFGVDLRGGINMVGSLNLDAWANTDDPNAERPQAKDIIPALVQRVNPSGTKEIMIRALGTDKIEVTIPSVSLQEAEEIWDRLVKAGKLEFRSVADLKYHRPQIDLARENAIAGSRERNVTEVDSKGVKKTVAYWSTLAREVVPGKEGDLSKVAPIKFIPEISHLVRDKSTGQIIENQEIRGCLGSVSEFHGRDFANWCQSQRIRSPQILLIQPDSEMNVEGKHLSRVSSDTDEKGRACVSFVTTDEGSMRLGLFTKMNEPDAQGGVHLMGIVLDDQLHSAPSIREAIYKRGQISGSFTQEEVDELVINLKSGKLDVALNNAPISKDFVNSTLGEELKEKGIWAITSSLLLVLVFMLFYYRFAGVVATIGLVLNVILILALVMAIDQPLTLTGLAGLVLTVGMSVDANVLVFERIREELDRGAALRMAIRNGFDKATTTIVDANVTTLITAIVLYVIGTEQIKGFSVTLILGILMSMFTAIIVARLIFDISERKRWLTKLNMTRLIERKKFSFLNKVGITGLVSTALIVVGLGSMFLLGQKILDHDLRGGSTVRMVFNEAQDIEQIRETLDSQNYEVKGEKIEFSVSGFGVLGGDDSMRDRVFKVDSNLMAWEGEENEERFEQLAELLERVFAGKLMRHHVDIQGQSSGSSEAPETSLQWRSAPALSHLSVLGMSPSALVHSMLVLQEEAPEVEEAGDVAGETVADSPESNPEAKPEESTEELDVAEKPDATTESAVTVPEDDESAGTDGDETSGGDFAAAQTSRTKVEYLNVERNLNVAPEISGKTLRSLIVEASRQIDLGLDDDQVKVNSPDVQPDESALTTISKDWNVTLNVTKDSDADEILAAWATSFNKKPYFPTASKVGGQIARETQYQALGAMIASLLGIIAYIWIRFQNVAFGLAAVIALVHDVAIVLGAIAVSHWLAGVFGFLGITEFKISLEIVAALLTVIGYSLNDTIVVFDRIREVRGKRTEITADMIDASISQTLSRTILTSLTTFIVVFILYCFGGEAIHGFAFALCVGIIVGTYSSIFVASPALLWLMNTVGLNPGIVDAAAE